MSEKSINIEQIMDEIRQEIKENGYKESDLSFKQIKPLLEYKDALKAETDLCRATATMNVLRPVGGGIKGRIRKIAQKLMMHTIIPIATEQSQFNTAMSQRGDQMLEMIEKQAEMINELEREVAHLRRRIDLLQKKERK